MVIQGNQITKKEDLSDTDEDQKEQTMAKVQNNSIHGLTMNFQKP